MESDDAALIAAVRAGDIASFEALVVKYQARVFSTARRYARLESEVEDIVQEVFIKAFQKLPSYRGDAPFEHWLMRMAVRTCYDFLRGHQRSRETSFSQLEDGESSWLERCAQDDRGGNEPDSGAKELVNRVLGQMSPAGRLVLTLLEIEERSVKEISALTGWSVPLVKVRAFRARAEMKKLLERMLPEERM